MQRAAIVTGTLGLGTALVFAAAALAATLFPSGPTVGGGWSNAGGWEKGIPVPAPMPIPVQPGVIVDEGKGGAVQVDDAAPGAGGTVQP